MRKKQYTLYKNICKQQKKLLVFPGTIYSDCLLEGCRENMERGKGRK